MPGLCVHGAGLQSPGPTVPWLAAAPFPSPLQPVRVRAASGTGGQQAGEEPQTKGRRLEHGSMVGVEGDRCVSLNVLGSIGLHFLGQPSAALEARLNSRTPYSFFCQPNREPS